MPHHAAASIHTHPLLSCPPAAPSTRSRHARAMPPSAAAPVHEHPLPLYPIAPPVSSSSPHSSQCRRVELHRNPVCVFLCHYTICTGCTCYHSMERTVLHKLQRLRWCNLGCSLRIQGLVPNRCYINSGIGINFPTTIKLVFKYIIENLGIISPHTPPV
jgi:hypothetical protein